MLGKLFKWGNYASNLFSLWWEDGVICEIFCFLKLHVETFCNWIVERNVTLLRLIRCPKYLSINCHFQYVLHNYEIKPFCIFALFWSNTNRKNFCILHRSVECAKRCRLFSRNMSRDYVMQVTSLNLNFSPIRLNDWIPFSCPRWKRIWQGKLLI